VDADLRRQGVRIGQQSPAPVMLAGTSTFVTATVVRNTLSYSRDQPPAIAHEEKRKRHEKAASQSTT
jgi:hypothetical protein